MEIIVNALSNGYLLLKKLAETSFKGFLIFIGVGLVFILIIFKINLIGENLLSPLLIIYTLFITTFELSRLGAAILYKQVDKHIITSAEKLEQLNGANFEPMVSFIIPCKNEEAVIGCTISKCFEADYPKNKIQVIAINDGSTDGTLKAMRQVQKKYPQLTIINWRKNRGKRHGMAEGFRQATGEIIIQLDSDSYIEPNDIRNLIKPFSNPEVGAVCAHADPENADQNLVTKIQAAYYFLSFRILKAAESTFLSVFCCSGCSSAYRRDLIMPIIDEWLDEKFLGLPVTWGDDRALTNWVLKLGSHAVYTDRVQAYTICPDSFKVFLKQQIRWKKGWFVNSLNASKFIFKTHPFVAFTYFFPLICLTLIAPIIAINNLLINPLIKGTVPLHYIAGILIVAALFTVYYRWIAPQNKYWPYVFIWSGINMVLLSFILYYALFDIQNRKWATR